MNILKNDFYKPKPALILGLAVLFAVITPLWHHKCSLLNGCSPWVVSMPLFGGFLETLFLGTAFFYTILFFLLLLLVNRGWANRNQFILAVLAIWIIGSVLFRLGLPYVNFDLSNELNNNQAFSIEGSYQNNFGRVEIGMSRDQVIATIGDPNEINKKVKETGKKYQQINILSPINGANFGHPIIGVNDEFKKLISFDNEIANLYDESGNWQGDSKLEVKAKNEYFGQGEINEAVLEGALKKGNINLMISGLPDKFFGKDFYFKTFKPFFKSNPNKVISFDSCEYYLGKILCYKNDKVALKANAQLGVIKAHVGTGTNWDNDQVRGYYLVLESAGPGPVIDASLFKSE